MDLFLHLALHVLTSLIAGYIVWKIWGKLSPSFLTAFIGGVLIDLDHLMDYFIAFGWSFNIEYFAKGYQFLKSDKIFILLHGWEYVIIVVILVVVFRKNIKIKTILLALGISIFFHLGADLFLNEGAQFKTYSAVYRMKNNFDLKPLVTEEHYIDHQKRKSLINF